MGRSVCAFIVIAMLSGAISAAPTGVPQTPDMVTAEAVIRPVKTSHRIMLAQTEVKYTAWFTERLLYGAQKAPLASISATSYVRDNVTDRAGRPVLFAFNGGPGASSTPLHFNAFGPKHFEIDASGARRLVDNPASLIDAADLVFIDPVGTGFSRERVGAVSGRYWSPEGDAQAALELIRQWLRDNGREQSPIFIAGESYGGFRLALMMQHAQDLPIAGLVLISPMLDATGSASAIGNDLPYILTLPSMAAAAWEHDRIDRHDRNLDQTFAEAAQFAQHDYALGLLQGSAIPLVERDRLAATMAAFIGLPVEEIERANLRIAPQDFLEHLLGDEGRIVSRLDTRISAPKPRTPLNPNRPAAANDPALGLGASNVIKSESVKTYMQNELKVETERDYLSLTLDVNFRWNWCDMLYGRDHKEPSFYLNPTPSIAQIMNQRPKMRLLLLGGYYDMAVPLLEPRYALSHAGVPLDRVSMYAFASGHSPLEGEENLRKGSKLVRDFLRGD